MSLVTFEEVKQFVVAHYKHSRLYGRNNASGWEDAYGDNIVKGYLDSLNDVHNTTPCLISLHESNTGTTVSFNRSDIIQYHYEQFDKDQLLREREAINRKLEEMAPSLEQLRNCATTSRKFSVLGVRRIRLNRGLYYRFDVCDEQTKHYY